MRPAPLANNENWKQAQHPSANGQANAKSIAKLGTLFTNDGKIGDV